MLTIARCIPSGTCTFYGMIQRNDNGVDYSLEPYQYARVLFVPARGLQSLLGSFREAFENSGTRTYIDYNYQSNIKITFV